MTFDRAHLLRRETPPAPLPEARTSPTDTSASRLAAMSETSQAETKKEIESLLGEPILKLIENSDVTDIWFNPNGSLFIAGPKMLPREFDTTHTSDQARRLIGVVSQSYGENFLSDVRPHVEGTLLFWNARFTGTTDPWSDGPMWALRIFRRLKLRYKNYRDTGRMSEAFYLDLKHIILQGLNMLIVGSQGKGKSTFADTTLTEAAALVPHTRQGIIQDTQEVRPDHKNVFTLYPRAISPQLPVFSAIKMYLRYTATSGSVGELREAPFELLDLWTTGTEHTGVTTIHGKTKDEGMRRFETLLMRQYPDLARSPLVMRRMIADAKFAIVVIGESREGLRGVVKDVSIISDVTEQGYRYARVEREDR